MRAIDALRLVVALYVAVYHWLASDYSSAAWGQDPGGVFPSAASWAPYGWLGVEVFFVISGFAICLSCWGRSLGDFFQSRVTRLYPAYWAAVLLTAVVASLTPAAGRPSTFREVLVNLTMLHEPAGVRAVDGVYWTLWVEMRFYLLFAFVVWGGLTFRRVTAFALAWTLLSVFATRAGSDLLYALAMPKFAPYFLVGIGLYLIHRFGHQLTTWLVIAANAVLGFHHAVERMEHQAADVVHQDLHAWVVGVILLCGSGVVLAAASGSLDWVRWGWVSWAGALTYPVYLLHDRMGLGLIHWLYVDNDVSAYAVVPVTLVATLVAAWLVHRFVERPLARWLKVHIATSRMAGLEPRDLLRRSGDTAASRS
jgi:peptidoglycan/LPS O-acetylase OafA/YrhL